MFDHILFDPFPAYPIYWSISCIQSYSILSFIQLHPILTFPCPYLSHLIQSACLICHILFHETHNKDKLRFRIKTFLRSVKEKRVEKWVRVFAGNLNFFILRFFDMSWKSSSRNKIRFLVFVIRDEFTKNLELYLPWGFEFTRREVQNKRFNSSDFSAPPLEFTIKPWVFQKRPRIWSENIHD